jgi:7-cyano-7-deazaguanine synthase in queuosine biosynthesis
LATPSAARATAAQARGDLGVALYNMGGSGLPGLGRTILLTASKLARPPSVRAWDFLSVALAVFAADRFVLRSDSADAWTRTIALNVELVDPGPWTAQAQPLADALRFLSGDIWYLHFYPGGQTPPDFAARLSDRDCVCLFSGGLDSLIGAMNLIAAKRRPFIISQASPKEGPVQANLASKIGLKDHRFEGRVTERWREPYEDSSRARSILFFAYGALAASSLGGELIVPENGLISINPPLTRRRVGSLSTRTTHPHFISSLQAVLNGVGLGVTLVNPYGTDTKGEMLAQCQHPDIAKLAHLSYSCGKGKRKNGQCGVCVPCLIRRAAFHAAGMKDDTPYRTQALEDAALNDDVQAARLAVAQLATRNVARWAAETGPLPHDPAHHAALIDTVRRGTEELRAYLNTVAWP